jgi:RimJ/RimL family protein N-acetyltransferase
VAEVATEAWVIGTIRLALQHAVNRTFDFGYSFHRDAWGQGFATEAARALVDIAFRDLGAHRVFATCDPRNVGSWRVMEKLGMRREGCLIRARARRDGWQDELVYGLLEDEWRASAPA